MATLSQAASDGPDDPWQRSDAFQINLPNRQSLRARHNRQTIEASVLSAPGAYEVRLPDSTHVFADTEFADGALSARVDGKPIRVRLVRSGNDVFAILDGATERLAIQSPDSGAYGRATATGGSVAAPMPGRIVSVNARAGDRVRADQVLVVLEAMKMEHSIRAPGDGKVEKVHCRVGDRVDEGFELISLQE